MIKFKKVHSASDIPVGEYIAYLENEQVAVVSVHNASNGTVAIVNGQFHWDRPRVIAYAPFPELVYEEYK